MTMVIRHLLGTDNVLGTVLNLLLMTTQGRTVISHVLWSKTLAQKD
jgi:hypothetical protein